MVWFLIRSSKNLMNILTLYIYYAIHLTQYNIKTISNLNRLKLQYR